MQIQRPLCGYYAGCMALLLLACSACQKSTHPPTFAVTGRITFPDGQPLESGSILFESLDGASAARGLVRNGDFRLGTFDEADGAIAGRHRAAVVPTPPENVDPDANRSESTIDPKFLHMDSSQLEFDVAPDHENHFLIRVTRGRR